MTLYLLATLAAALDCSAPEYHALDFWLGSWDVAAENGSFDGDNVIAPILAGCALRETWTEESGGRGESLFFYDRAQKRWKQVWVTTEGAWKEKAQIEAPKGSLRFQGEVPRRAGGVALDRTTLTPLDDGRVRQVIERSNDGGATWSKWAGLYSRKKPQCTAPEHRQMDFWLGDWDAAVKARKSPTSEEWAEARGSNHVSPGDNGCTIVEDFHAAGPGAPWTGRSVSQFWARQGKWRQTWIDESNSYLAFTGGPEGKDFALYGEPSTQNGVQRQMRMVFANIGRDGFSWRWEGTTDGGKSWRPEILIEYTRHR
jgi:hypothetical protein